ncbi:MAG: serine/threonine protein kinase [Verrucomicrobiaceae bacterium]|nr:serine/threonine protein kinase [Verrucomicrobiaceae bacterium]
MPHDLLECLSRSSQGEVWRARDRETGRIVAVKKPGGAAQLVSIRHPQVVRVLACHAEEMVMEWIEGNNLEKLGQLDAADFDTLVRQSLSGLAAIHETGFLHLDLKPENIFLREPRRTSAVSAVVSGSPQDTGTQGGLMVGQRVSSHRFREARRLFQKPNLWASLNLWEIFWNLFGRARSSAEFVIADLGNAQALPVETHQLRGSVHFMAPECFEGGRLDERTDLYALGCVFYFALTGRLPVEGELAPQVITAHLQHRVEPLEGAVGEWIDAFDGSKAHRSISQRPRGSG